MRHRTYHNKPAPALWQRGSFLELLARVEDQARARTSQIQRLNRMPKNGARARRARMLVGEGAYSKSVSSLRTELAPLDEAAQHRWGTELLPVSSRPEAAQAASSGEAYDEGDLSGPALVGVRFRAMSAPGPSGSRPEHLRELLAVRDR